LSLLEEVGITFLSGRDFRNTSPIERLTFAQKFSWNVFDDSLFDFFSYKGIKLGEIHAPALQKYLSIFLYYIDFIGQLAKSPHGFKRFIVFPSLEVVPDTSGLLALLEVNIVEEVARVVCTHHDIALSIPKSRINKLSIGRKIHSNFFVFKRAIFGEFLEILNLFMSLCKSHNGIRLLITDYWRNVEPFLAELPKAEVILMDRSEAFNVGLRNIWKYRMRFVHSNNYTSHKVRKIVSNQGQIFIDSWEQIKNNVECIQQARFNEYSIASSIKKAISHIIVVGGDGAVFDIENTQLMMYKLRPDIVMVRASVSTQRHFSILCYVARILGIPSMEVQHGLLYLGPGSYADHPSAEYIACYGPLARRGLRKIGYTDKKLFDIGSPRFDVYSEIRKISTIKKISKHINILCIIPGVSLGLWIDTYDVIDFCESIATSTAKVSGAITIMKLRPGCTHQAFYKQVFKRTFNPDSYRIAQSEPLVELFVNTDVVISCYSTALLESLLVHRPVIYSGILPIYESLGIELIEYKKEGALLLASTTKELTGHLFSVVESTSLREKLSSEATIFMKKHYSFVGEASSRLADTIQSIVK